jgi:hypothetical protein
VRDDFYVGWMNGTLDTGNLWFESTFVRVQVLEELDSSFADDGPTMRM